MVVLLHRRRTARLIPCRALTHFARKDILAPVYDRFTDGFCDCGHADRATPARLAPAASLIFWRRPCARSSPWALPSGSKPAAAVPLPLIDVRVQWSAQQPIFGGTAEILPRFAPRPTPPRSAENHRRDRPVHDLAHRKARLNSRHPRQAREFGAVDAFEILDIARHD